MRKPELQRAYLHSLEVESGLDSTLAELSILSQALFSAQVCLIDAHIVDNSNVWDFFLENERKLSEMMETLGPKEFPLVATCGRGGADCYKTLDIMLRPRDGKPMRFSSLSPSQIEQLAPGYDHLSEDERQERFLQIKGPDRQRYSKYLNVATKYFQLSEDTVITPKLPPDDGLYQEMTSVIEFLRNQCPEELTENDQRTCDALLKEMSPSDRPKNRQSLHKAVYGEHFPPYHGAIGWYTLGLPKDEAKDEWRFLVNDVYNHNLARSFGLWSAQDFHPRKARFQNVFRKEVQVEKAGLVKLASKIYPAYLSFDFVRNVRKQEQFWEHLSDPNLDPVVHRQYIAEEFAKHLIDQKRKDLVGEQWCEKIVVPLKLTRLAAPPIVAALAVIHGIKAGSSLEMCGLAGSASYIASEVMTNRLCQGVEDYFATIGKEQGARWSYKEEYKTFIDSLGATTQSVGHPALGPIPAG
jgi:hypothetical protein